MNVKIVGSPNGEFWKMEILSKKSLHFSVSSLLKIMIGNLDGIS